MKKIILILVVCFCANTLHAQISDKKTNTIDGNALLIKSKKQKTTGWILLGGGAGLTVAGLIIIQNVALKDPLGVYTGQQTKGVVPVVVGAAAILGSIPFFIAVGKNKTKAELMLKNEKVFSPKIQARQLAVNLKINL